MISAARARFAAALATVLVVAAPVAAASDDKDPLEPVEPPTGLAGLWAELDRLLADAAATAPSPPPVAVPVTWKARRVASFDFGAAVLAAAAGDLDGDGRAELVVLTERAVVVLGPGGRGLVERTRLAVPAEPASQRPRDPVGALAIARGERGPELWARSSSAGRGARYRLVDGALREVAPVAGFPFCADREDALVPGRNFVDDGAHPPFWTRRCRDDVVDGDGRRLAAEVTVAIDGSLTALVTTRCPDGGAPCPAARTVGLDGAGVAVEVDDVDRDGRLELITSAAGPPGDADAVVVRRLGPTGLAGKPVWRRAFSGGIAALASGDVDGDGDRDVFAAVRLAGARKVDLWLLD